MTDTRNHGPQDPALYKRAEYVEFSEKVAAVLRGEGDAVTRGQFLALSAEAVRAKRAIPELRADIAYDMVCVGSKLPEQHETPRREPRGVIKEIWDLFADLEVPDGHVVTLKERERGDYSGVDRRWHRIEEILAKEERRAQS